MSLNADVEKMIAFNVTLINYANFLQGQQLQNDFTTLRTNLAALGLTITGAQTGLGEAFLKLEGAKFVAALTSWNQILIDFAKFADPTYVPPVPAPLPT